MTVNLHRAFSLDIFLLFKFHRGWFPWSIGNNSTLHYSDVIMTAMASQIISVSIVYSTCWVNDAPIHCCTPWAKVPGFLYAIFFGLFVMIKSSIGNIFYVTGPSWGESPGHRWIPLTKTSEAELWYFLWTQLEMVTGVRPNRMWSAILEFQNFYWCSKNIHLSVAHAISG